MAGLWAGPFHVFQGVSAIAPAAVAKRQDHQSPWRPCALESVTLGSAEESS